MVKKIARRKRDCEVVAPIGCSATTTAGHSAHHHSAASSAAARAVSTTGRSAGAAKSTTGSRAFSRRTETEGLGDSQIDRELAGASSGITADKRLAGSWVGIKQAIGRGDQA